MEVMQEINWRTSRSGSKSLTCLNPISGVMVWVRTKTRGFRLQNMQIGSKTTRVLFRVAANTAVLPVPGQLRQGYAAIGCRCQFLLLLRRTIASPYFSGSIHMNSASAFLTAGRSVVLPNVVSVEIVGNEPNFEARITFEFPDRLTGESFPSSSFSWATDVQGEYRP